jgi:hypothetical protein
MMRNMLPGSRSGFRNAVAGQTDRFPSGILEYFAGLKEIDRPHNRTKDSTETTSAIMTLGMFVVLKTEIEY